MLAAPSTNSSTNPKEDARKLGELLKACDSALFVEKEIRKTQDELLTYKTKAVKLQEDEIKRLYDSQLNIFTSPVFWGLVGVLAGGVTAGILLK